MNLLVKLTGVDFRGTVGVHPGRRFFINPTQISQVYVKDDRAEPYTEIVLTNSDRVWCLETPEQINKSARF